MNAYADHADGLQSLQDELGSDCPSVWYGGRLVRALPASARIGLNNSIGGLSMDSDLSLICLASDFTVLPTSNQGFKYPGQTGKSYRINDVFVAPGGAQVRITANAAAQGL